MGKVKEKKRLIHRTNFLVAFTAAALVIIFLGRWIFAITNGYYDTFIKYGASVEDAMSNALGLTLTDEEALANLTYEKDWDYFTSSRLCDELYTESDGFDLHANYYDNGSDITVIYLHRFSEDGSSDFLAGSTLYDMYGCNILLPDSRCHGESEGEAVSYGYLEAEDLKAWISYMNETYGEKEYIIWGEGLGANTALFAEAKGYLSEDVKYIVAESTYPTIVTVAKRQMYKWFTVPAFPALNFMKMKLGGDGLGFSTDDMNLISALEEGSSDVPVVFLQSEGDEYIISDWSSEVYNAYEGEKCIVVGTGSHGTVFAEKYDDVVAALGGM
ncbi:MAG: alpha/beta hydrolase [Eubacterium sp.]|nr:alpha/beta hydrolase [Eubacterium sp.]